jgi:hypothetical protein
MSNTDKNKNESQSELTALLGGKPLTPKEIDLINKLRQEAIDKEESKNRMKEALFYSLNYGSWLNDHKRGTSISTFTEEFNAPRPKYFDNLRNLYHVVERIIKTAKDLST